MRQMSEPLVSVVTPVYNGAKFLAQCIESVLAQTYHNWEYVIVNNCSTDATLDIANRYADKDDRVRIINNTDFLPQIENWNHAMRQVSPDSIYCKVIHADDWLFPECISRMVSVGEANPSVGLVGSYTLRGKAVVHDGVAYPSTVLSGRDICRSTLLGDVYLFGAPSSLLMRSDIVRARESFYDEGVITADLVACYEVLQHWDFGFVHQVLTFTRLHDGTVTSSIEQFDDLWYQAWLIVLKRYGPIYLTKGEYNRRLTQHLKRYYRFLAKNALRCRKKAFWRYHNEGFKSVGSRLEMGRLAQAMCFQVLDAMGNPLNSLVTMRNNLRSK